MSIFASLFIFFLSLRRGEDGGVAPLLTKRLPAVTMGSGEDGMGAVGKGRGLEGKMAG